MARYVFFKFFFKQRIDSQLNLFGSSANHLCVKGSSDIDVCLIIKFEPRKRSNSKAQTIEQDLLQQQQQQQELGDEQELDVQQQENAESSQQQAQDDLDDDELDELVQELESNVRKKPRRKRYRKPLTEEQALQKNYVSQLKQFLEKHHMRNIIPIFSARVPIVKFVDPDSGLNCDICVNNILAVHNTRLLRTYSILDIRCAQLIYVVKYWASKREINQPYHGTLSSYSYVLLVIHYLQNLANPVLPVLQDPRQFPDVTLTQNIVDGLDAHNYDCSYFDNVNSLQGGSPSFTTTNTESVGELLVGFFKYYAFEFDFGQDVISIRLMPQSIRELRKKDEGEVTRYLNKKEKGWTNYAQVRNAMCIEDPFETNFNVARTCTHEGLAQIQYELVRAYHMLCKQADLKTSVCAHLSQNKA